MTTRRAWNQGAEVQITVGAVKTDSPHIPSPYRPYSPSIGWLEKQIQKQKQIQRKKKSVYISLWFFLSEKNIKTGVSREYHHT